MTSKRIAPEHIKVDTSETAVRITQEGTGNAFVVEDATNPDSTPFVIDNQGRVGVKKTPTRDLDVDGLIAATNIIPGYTTTATSAGTTTLTVTSAQQQFFTGTLGHTVTLPVASTLSLGQFFTVHNNSTGALLVNSSGGNIIKTVGPNSTAQLTCILISGTTAASWDTDIWDTDIAEGSAFSLTATANATSTLSVSSAQRQFFNGTLDQTIVLPVVSTLTLGQFYVVENNSTGQITVQSSGLNSVVVLAANRSAQITAVAITGTGSSSWDVEHSGASTPLATTAYVDTSVSNLVDAAPGTLDTLNELAAALGDDPNFATTVATQIGNKADSSLVSSHTGATTSVHGITDTSLLVYTADSRLSDQRVPTDNSVTSAKIVDGAILNIDINASAAIVDTKLATISTASKVSNSATTATNVNTASSIVSRDASGNFAAGTITAAITGTASGNLVSGGALGTPSSGAADNMTSNTETAGNSSTHIATTAFVTTADNLKANLASPTFTGVPAAPTAAALTNTTQLATTAFVRAGVASGVGQVTHFAIACSDEETVITTGVAKVTFRMPYAMTLTSVRANVNTASSSGLVTVDINEGGTSILSTKLTIDANERTSVTASTPPVISDTALANDQEITVDIDVAGTGAKGLKIVLIGTLA